MAEMYEGELWERRRDESDKAFAAFSIYRDLGAGRSIDAAYREHVVREQGQNRGETGAGATRAPAKAGGRAPSHWQTWSARFAWPERAAAYDAHLDRQARRELEREHINHLEAFRGRMRRAAAAFTETQLTLMQKVNERLKTLAPEDLKPALIPGYVKAITEAGAVAADAEAMALGVEDILREQDGMRR